MGEIVRRTTEIDRREILRRMRIVINNSQIKAHRACPRKRHYAYDLARRARRQAGTLRFGTAFHRGLEAWWRALAGSTPPHTDSRCESAIVDALDAIDSAGLDPFDATKASVLMVFYHERWIGEPLITIDVEASFVAPLVNPTTGRRSATYDLGGTIDVLVRHAELGSAYVVEHKTSSEDLSPDADYWLRLRLDSQVSTYDVGARALLDGEHVEGCIYDVIGKPALRPLLATPIEQRKYTKPTKKDPVPRLYANQREADETPEEYADRLIEHIGDNPARYLARAKVVRLESDRHSAARDTWMYTQSIRTARRLDMHPRNPDACEMYRRRCEFWPVCTGMADINDPVLYEPAER